jgi:photosystem II stability/assembly factor-like uncharacterized protein
MPELSLETRLGAARADLLARIETPELAEIRRRATVHRRRRNTVRGGVAVLGLLLVGSIAAVVRPAGVDRPPPPVGATPTASVRPEWRGSGLTLLGLTADVSDLPGDLYDVQFVDNDHGYALLAQCPKAGACDLAFATTADSGLTWTRRTPPVIAAPAAALPALAPVGPDTVALLGRGAGQNDWISRDGGVTWAATPTANGAPAAAVGGDGRLVLHAGAGGCSAHDVDALGTDGSRRRLVEQPPLDVCWIAPTAAADGSWWVGGVVDRHPAAAVSHDGGFSWQPVTFTGPAGSWTKVVPFGSEVYIIVVTGEPGTGTAAVRALYRSTDQGHTFARYGDPAGMATLAGDLVPLLDGRLVAAAPGWRISGVDGTDFRDGSPQLPWVGRLQRTDAGWVAYDLFGSGWAAFSPDGATWHKIHVR